MKTKTIAVILILLLTLGMTACNPITGYPDGTVTVNLSGAGAIDGDFLYAYVYTYGETLTDETHPETVLACGGIEISSGTADMILTVDDGAFGPTGVLWTGKGGVSYDIYIYTDDSDNSPTEETIKWSIPHRISP